MPARANGVVFVRRFAPHVAIWVLIAVLLGPHLSSGEFWWTDEARHAMGGIFVLDLIRDLPVSDPMGYALRYFGQYPALALNWYPPFFYFVEAVAFSLFGQHAEVARALVLVFSLVAASAWIAWVRRTWGYSIALLSAALFVSVPEWNIWARSVMLEVPAIAMIILAVLCFERYLEQPNYRRSITCGAVIAAGLLLKQTAAFILPALLAYGAICGRRRALLVRQALPAYALAALVIVLLAVHAAKFGAVGLAATLGDQHASAGHAPERFSLQRWLLHPKALVDTWGWLLALSAVGAFLPGWRKEPQLPLIFAWIASWYLLGTLFFGSPDNAPRYTMYVMPPLALLAARPVFVAGPSRVPRLGLLVLCCGLFALNVWRSAAMPARSTSGYAAVAEMIVKSGTTGPILYAGKNDGNFIFRLRALDEKRRHVVLRGDKMLVSLSVHKYFGMKSHVQTSEDVIALIRRYGVEFILIERPDIVGLAEFRLLEETLKGRPFERVATVPASATSGIDSPLTVEVFRFLEYKAAPANEVVIPLPHLDREIRFKTGEVDARP